MLRMLTAGVSFQNLLAYFLSSAVIVFLVLPVHEFAHGYVAYKLGDPTPRYQGRLTLNPLAHIDIIGSLCILLLGFGWAKPVQINARYFRNPKKDMAITALAGPVSNLLVAFIATLILYLYVFAVGQNISVFILYFLLFLIEINIHLAVFNLIPIPPLDGSRLLSAFLPDRQYYKLMQYERFIFYGVLALIWIGALDRPISFLSNGIITAYKGIFNLIFPDYVGALVQYIL